MKKRRRKREEEEEEEEEEKRISKLVRIGDERNNKKKVKSI